MIVVQTSTSSSPCDEVEHHLLELALRHLAVGDGDPRLGHEASQLLGRRLDGLDPVVDVEDLAAAVQLAVDRLADQAVVVLGDARPDRQPVLGRRLDDAQVAHADQRHVQRARDRRGRQRQHVDLACAAT